VQRILETLQQAEVSSSERFSAAEMQSPAISPYPLWYYGMKVRQALRRRFPQEPDFERRRAGADSGLSGETG